MAKMPKTAQTATTTRQGKPTWRFIGDTIVTREYMRSGAASNRSGSASCIASSKAADAFAGTPYHTCA